MINKLYTVLAFLLFTTVCLAQAPEKLSYQAVVRNASNQLVKEQTIQMQISVLKGSTAVYTETQTPSTNTKGLISIEIGTGTTADDFSGIDWTNGTFFIETQIDIDGGGYDITGTSQLLSVPYAMYTKTAGNGLPAGGTEGQVLKMVNGTAVWADAGTPTPIGTPAVIGDFRDGGVVFWVDPTDNTHGLVCALQDSSYGIQWYNGTDIETGGNRTKIGAGSANTNAIIAAQGQIETNYAAGLAHAFTGGNYKDWFLPSMDELHSMYVNRLVVNATALANSGDSFSGGYYWSSTESNAAAAEVYRLFDGRKSSSLKSDATHNVRAVRAF